MNNVTLNQYRLRLSDSTWWDVYEADPDTAYDVIRTHFDQRGKPFPLQEKLTIDLVGSDIKGYYFSVYRDANGEDYTNGGFSSWATRIFVMETAGVSPGVMTWDGKTPVCTIGSNLPGRYHFKSPHDWLGRPMAGGNYAASCDTPMPPGQYMIGMRQVKNHGF